MKFPYAVKVNGKIYAPNTEVADKAAVAKKETATKANTKENKE